MSKTIKYWIDTPYAINNSNRLIVSSTDLQQKPKYGGAYYDKDGKFIYIKRVLYRNPAVIVFWNDGTKTVSKCLKTDSFSKECGLMTCITRKVLGKEFVRKTLEDWCIDELDEITMSDVRRNHVKEKDNEEDCSMEEV